MTAYLHLVANVCPRYLCFFESFRTGAWPRKDSNLMYCKDEWFRRGGCASSRESCMEIAVVTCRTAGFDSVEPHFAEEIIRE